MKIIPAIDLRDGHCVQLVGGDPLHERLRLPDPVAQARAFEHDGASLLHVVDLDRALGRGTNLQAVKSIIEAVRIPVQVGGGIRDFEGVDDLLNAGASKVVVGTRAVKDEQFLNEAAKRYGARILVAVDARGDEIVVKGWTEGSGRKLHEFVSHLDPLSLGGLLYTDVGREGRMGGANVDGVRAIAQKIHTPLIASGGIRSIEDLKELKAAGAWGAVIGMALYTGAFNLQDAMKAVE
ncbi:MAG: 1-(5-phosphoribosyl)-5-[(5-phosphoribosylamino)methylideneamino]imidazole-4-carboxamide isomerase [Thermoplasmatota archaeon]